MNPEIHITLSLDRLNQLLGYLGGRKLNQVLDLYMDIRTQANTQIAQIQRDAQESMPSMLPPRPNGADAEAAYQRRG